MVSKISSSRSTSFDSELLSTTIISKAKPTVCWTTESIHSPVYRAELKFTIIIETSIARYSKLIFRNYISPSYSMPSSSLYQAITGVFMAYHYEKHPKPKFGKLFAMKQHLF
uniref:Uncharacterized protein n=1 Tax=uncultured Chromatiales bacterium HF0200_41F04 TaxID=710740 RepID=E0XV31_9GAMM|nr:hypothetical protein [uncultured Chromatiales bacterium HF0200_41F04]